MTSGVAIDHQDLVAEFEWTRVRHGGDLFAAARIFDVSPTCLEARLRRAARAGYVTTFTSVPKGQL